MVMRPSASWRAASSRARLKEPRRRLPANATTRRTSFNACSAMPASRTQERERLGAFRSEEHTSELQSQSNLVCRLLLEKKIDSMTHTLTLSDHTDDSNHYIVH